MAGTVYHSTIKYSALSTPNEIHLVILEPGSNDDPLSCHLIHVELESREYEALSYEWGHIQDLGPTILVGGELAQVRKNLFDALWHIRMTTDERCI